MRLMVLWDIDHTLIENAGVSKEIYAAAYTDLAGEPPVERASTEGRTDRLIMREMFRRGGLHEPSWELIENALAQAGKARLDDLRRRGSALPGVLDVLKAASMQPAWVSSVLTGNIAGNARVKLSAFDLDGLVDLTVGAYGADALNRPDLVAVARERAQRLRGLPIDAPVVLVGDTPRDVEAALTTGTAVIAVATGVHGEAELRAAGAPVVLPELTDTGHVLDLIAAAAKG
jgi:phosphoglycolate phosphatase-like HAD superfamily hydrolase